MGWNPWRHISDQYPHITVHTHHELPQRVWGLQSGNHIWLCRLLNQVKRRCTLAHEIIHLERGPVPTDARGQSREEKAVDRIAARRLITITDLIEGMRWTRNRDELADHLWVDVPTLQARIDGLDPLEVAQLEHELEGEWIP